MGVRKAIEGGLGEVIVACEMKELCESVEDRLPAALGDLGCDRVSVVVVQDMVNSS